MSDKSNLGSDQGSTTNSTQRRPYSPPAFLVARAFERQSLSCSGGMISANRFPQGCTFKS